MLLYKNFLIIATAVIATTSAVRSDITVQKGFVPPLTRPEASDSALYVVGDRNGYRITPLGTEKLSNATCGHHVKHSHGLGPNGEAYATGQCEVDATKGAQSFQIDCLNKHHPTKLAKGKGQAFVTFTDPFYYDQTKQSTIIIGASNKIWVGYNSSFLVEQPKKLQKAPSNFEAKGNDASAIINCWDDSIGPVYP